MTEASNMFFNTTTVELLVNIKRMQPVNCTELAREVETTHANAVNMKQSFKEHGLVDLEKDGRQVLITLTGRGREAATRFENLLELLDGDEQ